MFVHQRLIWTGLILALVGHATVVLATEEAAFHGAWKWISAYDWVSGEEEVADGSWTQILNLSPDGSYRIIQDGSEREAGNWSIRPCQESNAGCSGQDVLVLDATCGTSDSYACEFEFAFCAADCAPASVQPVKGLQLSHLPDPMLDGGVETYEWLGSVSSAMRSWGAVKARF